MRKYKQAIHQEFMQLECYQEAGYNLCDIAIKIGKDKSTLGRWIQKYGDENGKFKATTAWESFQTVKRSANTHPKILSNILLEKFVLEKIETYWSPQQIAGRWKTLSGEAISHETIYQYIFKYHPEMVKLFFRRKGRKYRNRRLEAANMKGQIADMNMITNRPLEVENRKEIGHWEGDTVIGANHKGSFVTNVERKTGFLLARTLPNKQADTLADITEEMFTELPDELRISLTVDQGREFAWHKIISVATKMDVYFCHKSSPWERGTNENTNGLLRQFFPKNTDLSTVSEIELQKYVKLLNNRPRKRLQYRTPAELFNDELKNKLISCTSD
jgi:IS30 family transposase